MKRRLLYIGDAACESGFARASHAYIDGLLPDFDVWVLGLNYVGDPHRYKNLDGTPLRIYPAHLGGDGFGVRRTMEMMCVSVPDVVVVQNDPWNVPAYLDAVEKGDAELIKLGARPTGWKTPVVAIVAVDGLNCRGAGLNRCASVVFWTRYGEVQARTGGYTGPSAVVPLGVNLETFYPVDKLKSRGALFGTPKADGSGNVLKREFADAFIVLNVNRNQPRKRLDLTIAYFAEWVHTHDVPNAKLYLHVAPTGDSGYDIVQLSQYYRVNNRLILADPGVNKGVADDVLNITYNASDVILTTSQGEGMGLTTFEALACERPVIHGRWAALGDLCTQGTIPVACSEIAVTPNNINVIGGIPDRHEVIAALHKLYVDAELRSRLGREGRELVSDGRFNWKNCGIGVNRAVLDALEKPKVILELNTSALVEAVLPKAL